MRIASFVAGCLLAAGTALFAHAQGEDAKAFVQREANRGVSILSNDSLSAADRRAQFRDFILGLVDQQRIAKFSLGQYAKQISAADFNAFVDAFKDYGVAVYEARLSRYKGQTLNVSGVVERAPNDIVVTTDLSGPEGSQSSGEPLHVAFRLSTDGGAFKAIDIQVAGIWLAIDQRSQITGFLGQHNGDINALIADLKTRAANVRAGLAEE